MRVYSLNELDALFLILFHSVLLIKSQPPNRHLSDFIINFLRNPITFFWPLLLFFLYKLISHFLSFSLLLIFFQSNIEESKCKCENTMSGKLSFAAENERNFCMSDRLDENMLHTQSRSLGFGGCQSVHNKWLLVKPACCPAATENHNHPSSLHLWLTFIASYKISEIKKSKT